MKKEARKLRMRGLSHSEIATKLEQPQRRIRSWVEDIKLTSDQISKKISKKKKEAGINRYKKNKISKINLQEHIQKFGLFGTRDRMGVTEGVIRYWAETYGIPIHHPPPVARYDKCQVCKIEYSKNQKKKGKLCNTCVSKIRRLKSKRKAVAYKGSKCVECGYKATDNNYAAFEFHHTDGDKDKGIGEILNRKWESIQKELDKCIVVCSNCHRIKHSDYGNEDILNYLNSE